MANNLKAARMAAGLSQAELARKIDVTKQAVSLYENGSRMPERETWIKMAKVLDVSENYLLGNATRPDGADTSAISLGISFDELTAKLKQMFEDDNLASATADQVIEATFAVMSDKGDELRAKHLSSGDIVAVVRDKLWEVMSSILHDIGNAPINEEQQLVLNVVSKAISELPQDQRG